MKESNDIDKILRSKMEGFEVKGSSSLRFRFYWLIMKKRILGTLLLVFLLSTLGIAVDMMWLENAADKDQIVQQNNELNTKPETPQKGETTLVIEKKAGEEIQAKKTEKSTTSVVKPKHESQATEDNKTQLVAAGKPEMHIAVEKENPENQQESSPGNAEKMMQQATAYEADDMMHELALVQMESLHSGPFSSLHEIALLPDRAFLDDYYLPEEERIPRFGISLSAGPSIYRNTYQVGNLEDGLYKFESLSNNPLKDINAELGISYRFGNWEIRSGITYNHYKASFSITKDERFLDNEQSYYRQDTIWGYIYDPPILGKPVILGFDSTFIEVYDTQTHFVSTEARFSYLGIPLNLGYLFEKGKYFMKPWVGLNFSFLVQASGNLPLPSANEVTAIDQGSEYLQRFITRMNAGLEIGYAILPEQNIFVKAYYQQSFTAAYINYPLKNKNHLIAIELGYKINF